MLAQVISGGQTGADQAGLRAAAAFGVPTGGWMPAGFRTLDGPAPELAARFGLRAHRAAGYPARTAANARDADGTIRFAVDFSTPGERCTRAALLRLGRPHFDVLVSDPPPVGEAVAWIRRAGVRVLNVAGNADTGRARGVIGPFVEAYLGEVLALLGHRPVEAGAGEWAERSPQVVGG